MSDKNTFRVLYVIVALQFVAAVMPCYHAPHYRAEMVIPFLFIAVAEAIWVWYLRKGL